MDKHRTLAPTNMDAVSHTGLELADLVKLVGSGPQEAHLSPCLQGLDFKHVSLFLFLVF